MRSGFLLRERMEEMNKRTWQNITKPQACVEGKLHKSLKKKNNGIMDIQKLNTDYILIKSNLLHT